MGAEAPKKVEPPKTLPAKPAEDQNTKPAEVSAAPSTKAVSQPLSPAPSVPSVNRTAPAASAPLESRPAPSPVEPLDKSIQVMLNGQTLILPAKEEGAPYYVMDLLEHSGIDFDNLDRGVEMQVNGSNCSFTQELKPRDDVVIRYLEK